MIPINLTKPYDIAVMFGIFALVIVTIGFGVQSVNDYQDADADESFFTRVQYNVNSTQGLVGAGESISTGLTGEEGASTSPSEENILVRGFNSMLQLGKTFKTTEEALGDGITILGIDPIYLLIYTSLLLTAFGVIAYTWLRAT